MAIAYIDPQSVHNPATGLVIPAAWGDVIRDDLEAHEDPAVCSVYNSVVQSVANSTDVVLTADSENYDSDAMHSIVTNTSRITAQKAGRYYISARIQFAANVTGRRLVTFITNGASPVNGDQRPPVTGGFSTFTSTFMTRVLAVGDYVEVRALQSSGGALDVTLLEFYAKRDSRG